MGAFFEPMHVDEMVFCPSCGVPLRPDLDTFAHAFSGGSPSCYKCQQEFGLWDAVLKQVPAHIAVESAMAPVVREGLEGFASKGHIEDFLQNGATFSHQMNVLVPILEFIVGVVHLPDNIRGELNRLRSLRNKVAHSGACSLLTRDDAGRLLVAAIFGIRYAEVLLAAIRRARADGRLH